MIRQIGNLIIVNCGGKVDNLIPINTKETLLDFLLIEEKITLILIELLRRCSLF